MREMAQVTIEVSEERYVLNTTIDGRLPVENVRTILPVVTRVYDYNNMQRHVVNLQAQHFRPPPDGWLDRIYFCLPGKLSHESKYYYRTTYGEEEYPFYNLFFQVRVGKEN